MKRIQSIEKWVLWLVFVAWGVGAFLVLLSDTLPDEELTKADVWRFLWNKVNAIVHLALCYILHTIAAYKKWIPKL